MPREKIYKYPDPHKIQTNEASLELRLWDYEACLKNKFKWDDFLILAPSWAILLTSDFSGIWFLSNNEVKGIYFAFMVFGTLNLIKNKIPVIKKFFNGKNSAHEFIEEIKKECK